MRRVHVIVRGLVQGVGYRWSTRLVARQNGVTGWVRNLDDGSVEAELQGAPAQVDAVLEWMAEGPPGAHVDSVDASDLAPTEHGGFTVR
ncbi:acylphosphatase [Aeromicrobium duanguangcaii]|uniref:acylphosphatase n=1 Tax=Aeromicrobium duanguangcaii TaxID=2968086 RepID=A0ABY5KFS9_9ACTN|nr:acylphosphatase [Aeromicrobium duanguangcaii]MCD9153600.1 acylphosphatase [Aeromicrobium duanguangcaii]MCL3836415.1 acylphosphatase [Aeromicrobium duanguangcaii]UUI69317.1 acylphosphatase [Aeromicrobium duanguangcaii]